MRNKFRRIRVFAFVAIFLAFITLIVVDLTATDKYTEGIKGKVVLTTTVNGESIDHMFGGMSVVLSGKYMVECNRLIQTSVWDSINQKIIAFQPGDSGYLVLQNYAVTDMTAGVVVQFDTSLLSPSVVACFPERQKKHGFMPNGQKEVDVLVSVIPKFEYEKDTVFDNVKYKVLSYAKGERVRRSYILEKGTAYLDSRTKNFPVKLSHHLDSTYGGWVNRIDMVARDTITGRKDAVIAKLTFFPKLDNHEQYVIDRLIPVAKAYLDTANIKR